MLESEALQKWCPQARIPLRSMTLGNEDLVIVSANRCDEGTASSYCFGSGCMSWRWNQDQFKCSECGALYDRCFDECSDDYTSEPKCKGTLEIYREGFCGLAGKE